MCGALTVSLPDMTSKAVTVVPAKAGTQRLSRQRHWIPACAGMTVARIAA